MPNKIKSLADYLESIRDYPQGIFTIETTIENKIFQIQYNETTITEEKVIKFASSLSL